MRVAAVALVLIVGAAVVLAFANTLNSWVLGGLLGGLAAILLSIPISLALFTLLARRHEAHQHPQEHIFEDEPEFAEEMDAEPVVYDADGYALPVDENFSTDRRLASPRDQRRLPISGYLPLPPAGQELDEYDEDAEQLAYREPRSYPRQPRNPARSQESVDETPSPSSTSASRRHPSTRSLAQHQSAALHQARQEAQQQRLSPKRPGGSGSLSRRPSGSQLSSSQRPAARPLRPQSSGSRHSDDDNDIRFTRQQHASSSWDQDEDFSTEELDTRARQSPQRRGYRPNPRSPRSIDPWTGALEDADGQDETQLRRSRRDPERLSGSLRNPLVRRAPYLYDDDALREEFAQQLENERPITRRSSLYGQYEDNQEY